MPRNARMVAVGYPHHLTQRGNNREPVFFDDQDRLTYLGLLEHYAAKYYLEIWAYCLMTNHVHLLVVPHQEDHLGQGIGLTNMTYTQHVNRKYSRSGRIWQNRFFSSVVDTDAYLWAVARYIENNPVTAGLAPEAGAYEWSSAQHHMEATIDPVMKNSTWLSETDREDYRKFLENDDKRMATMIAHATRSGRPICSPERTAYFEERFNRIFWEKGTLRQVSLWCPFLCKPSFPLLQRVYCAIICADCYCISLI